MREADVLDFCNKPANALVAGDGYYYNALPKFFHKPVVNLACQNELQVFAGPQLFVSRLLEPARHTLTPVPEYVLPTKYRKARPISLHAP